jgi:hypothetical protein
MIRIIPVLIVGVAACVASAAAAQNEDPPFHFRSHGINVIIHKHTRGPIDLPGGATIQLGKPAEMICANTGGCMLTMQAKAGLVDFTEGEMCAQIDGSSDPLFCDGEQGFVTFLETARVTSGQHTVQLTVTNQNGAYDGHISYWEVIYTMYDKGH